MASCRYALKSNPSKTVDAKYLGYWSVKWSSEQAAAALQAFQMPPLAHYPIIREALRQPFHTSLVLIALHGATYWAVAAGFPAMAGRIDAETYARTLDDLRRGRDDCLTELSTPGNEPLPKATAQQVTSLFERFLGDILSDLSGPPPHGTDAPDAADARISRATATFVAILQANFKVDFPPEQQVEFGRLVDAAVRKLAAAAQDALQIQA